MKAAGPWSPPLHLFLMFSIYLLVPRLLWGGHQKCKLSSTGQLCRCLKTAPGLPPFVLKPDTPVPSFTMTDLGYLPIQMPLYSFTIIIDTKTIYWSVSFGSDIVLHKSFCRMFYLRHPLTKSYWIKDLTKERKSVFYKSSMEAWSFGRKKWSCLNIKCAWS